MHPNNSDAAAEGEGLSCGVRDALADPIVQALLVADCVDPRDVMALSSRMGAWLSHREAIVARAPRPGFRCDTFEKNENDLVWPEQAADG
jgi:hypothetical protein